MADRAVTVAVVMGGPSAEHEISLRSGEGIAAALTRTGHQALPLVIPQAGTNEDALAWLRHALASLTVDVVFVALHGTFGEDGAVQALCEAQHLAYVGSGPAASRVGLDKAGSRRRFEAAGLAVPAWWLLNGGQPTIGLPRDVVYPLFVKPRRQGSSLGISFVECSDALDAALRLARRYDADGDVIVEARVPGRELTVGILDERALPVVEIRPHETFFNFAAKYTAGKTEYLVPAPLSASAAAAAQAAALAAHRAIGCRHVSRVDLILDPKGVPVILEANTIPGFTATSLLPKAAACAGLRYDALCQRLAQMAWADAVRLTHA